MKVYHSLQEFPKLSYAVVTTGTFDGLHAGHKVILERVKEIAKANDGETVVLTFWPHPRILLQPHDHGIELLSSLEEKIELMERMGINHLLILPFTKELASYSSHQYVDEILVSGINTKKLVIGYDHHFGKNREGSFESLKKEQAQYGFEVEQIPAQQVDEVAVSSTSIRKALKSGDLATAKKFLGYTYQLRGEVMPGDRIGRSIKFPTANIELKEAAKLIPKEGVYAVRAILEEEQVQVEGMLNLGPRPTLNSDEKRIEVHLLGFKEEIYGEPMTLKIDYFVRPIIKFDSLDELKVQIEKDRIEILTYYSDRKTKTD